jgi:hypothetical protein
MPQIQSRIIFQNQHYVVCLTRAGLSVQRVKTGKGICLPHGDACNEWVAAFDTAIDNAERNRLAGRILA